MLEVRHNAAGGLPPAPPFAVCFHYNEVIPGLADEIDLNSMLNANAWLVHQFSPQIDHG